MKVEILKSNPYIGGMRPVLESTEVDGKKFFELTIEEYAHFVENSRFYKVKSKKLYFDEAYKSKVEAAEEEVGKAKKRLGLRIELCNLKEQEEKFKKYNIVTEELEIKISELQEKIKAAGGEPYIKEEAEEDNE
jgi:hypothetical protein